MKDESVAPVVTADVRARHAEMMALSGGTGRPEDYRDRLSFILPARHVAVPNLLVFCGCCQGPIVVEPRIGLWVSWQKSGAIAPLCAVCLEYLKQREGPGAILVHPEYDSFGQGFRSGLASMTPVELAQRRMAAVESLMPREEIAARGMDGAAVAREAFMETAGAIRGLEELWRKQRPARLKLGRIMIGLMASSTAESLGEFNETVLVVPGALQAFAEAQAEASGGALA